MKRAIVVTLLLLAVSSLMATVVLAQDDIYVSTASWVQHRVYEDGRDLYRLCFSLVSCSGSTCTGNFVRDKTIQSVELWTAPPGSNGASLSEIHSGDEFTTSNENVVYPQYGYPGSRWFYPSIPLVFPDVNEVYYLVDLDKPLVDGTGFFIVVGTTDNLWTPRPGETGFWTAQFHLQTLPILEAHTIKTHWEKDGDLLITWDPPYDYNTPISPIYDLRTQARLLIILKDEIQGKSEYMKYLLCAMPTHLGAWFVPKDIVDQLGNRGDKIELQLVVRTTDNCNRTYSKRDSVKLR